MEFINLVLDIFQNLDVYLRDWSDQLGPWFYVILFAIVFCETGLVVTPFLPGDSLLFAVGAIAAIPGSNLSVPLLLLLLIAAAILGDAVNYCFGYRVGPRVFRSETSRLFNKKHLVRTQEFYDKYGGKTIILARFIPIIRTFAPFVAGIGKMEYRRFALYNVTGGIAWVTIFLLGGYYFGNTQTVQDNFHIVIVAIILISILPPVVEVVLARRRGRAERRLAPARGLPPAVTSNGTEAHAHDQASGEGVRVQG
jgi:membrane-associated protein